MPRKNQNAIRNFFVIDETKNTSTCLILNCSKKTLGTTHAGNLETHVKRHHSQVHIGFEAERLTRNRKRKEKEDARGEVKIIRLLCQTILIFVLFYRSSTSIFHSLQSEVI